MRQLSQAHMPVNKGVPWYRLRID